MPSLVHPALVWEPDLPIQWLCTQPSPLKHVPTSILGEDQGCCSFSLQQVLLAGAFALSGLLLNNSLYQEELDSNVYFLLGLTAYTTAVALLAEVSDMHAHARVIRCDCCIFFTYLACRCVGTPGMGMYPGAVYAL